MSEREPEIIGDIPAFIKLQNRDEMKKSVKFCVRFFQQGKFYTSMYTERGIKKQFGVTRGKEMLRSWAKSKNVNAQQLAKVDKEVKTLAQRLKETKEKYKQEANNAKKMHDDLKDTLKEASSRAERFETRSNELSEKVKELKNSLSQTSEEKEDLARNLSAREKDSESLQASFGELQKGTKDLQLLYESARDEIIQLKQQLTENASKENEISTEKMNEFKGAISSFNNILRTIEQKWIDDVEMLRDSVKMANGWLELLPNMQKRMKELGMQNGLVHMAQIESMFDDEVVVAAGIVPNY
jgi:chromosome segregation ATPase